MVVVVIMAMNTVVDHPDEPFFFEKQLLLDGHFCKPYSVAHVKKTWLVSCSSVGHFASKTRSLGTCKVAYWMVGHFASKTRSPGTCKVAC